MTSRHRLLVALFTVGALIVAIDWPVLTAQAISMDDDLFVGTNPLVTHPSWPSVGRFFSEVRRPSTVRGYYVPLTMTSLMLDDAAGGRPRELTVFHRTNLALHVLTCMALLVLLYRLFGSLVPVALAALLFGLHPLAAQPIAWVAERKTMLATPLAIASIVCYVEFCRGKRTRWMAGCVGFFVLGLLSKPTVTMLPVLLLILDYWPLRRLSFRTVIEKWPLFLLSLVSGITTVISNQSTLGLGPANSIGLPLWGLRIGYLLGFYLGKIFWPAHLACIYDTPQPFSFTNPAVVLTALVPVVLTLVLALLALRGNRGPLAGWLFFVCAIAPALGVVRDKWWPEADKYVYFPAAGLVLVFAWALTTAWNSRRPSSAALRRILLTIVLALALVEARGMRRTLAHWKDSLTLWTHIVEVAPHAAQARNFLGVNLQLASQHERAFEQFRIALTLHPANEDPYLNVGSMLLERGQLEQALRYFQLAHQRFPESPYVAYWLGRAAKTAGKLDEASAWFRRALELKPDYIEARKEFGIVLAMQGHTEQSIEMLREVVASDPSATRTRLALAMALLNDHAHSEAREQLRIVILEEPALASPYILLAWLLATSPDAAVHDPAEAMRLAERAVQLTAGRDPSALDAWGAAQAAAGHFDLAAESAKSALVMAANSHADSLAPAIRTRLTMYQRRIAYVAIDDTVSGRPGR